ncbi:protein-associating with the carboxyl-terminal domain of ezrin-like [Lingula anatina]|uniref:Protein-associating with the carboxyl-terminal domain of ezrin-like n=1 Tax=Lingula anatina TaxID=7574 RepID=A0A1S3K9I8_LINAN|nr:protein-associating with the carboxyl-terminal domain of ezrin-like [Lingula anatina]|eukprot:XP_013419162.1 protein-associating with the carboxyl-terminal domain of ezrin-like [Lingula anatina]
MGNESSSLEDCTLQPALDFEALRGWSVCPAQWKDGSKVTVFFHKKPEPEKRGFVENAVKQLKTIRHPSVLRFFTSFTSPQGLHIVTKPVSPLLLALEAGKLSSVEISAGIYNIIEALSFLHERVGVSHNNVSLASIFVSEDGSWKLGGLDYVCKLTEATIEQLQACKTFRNEEAITPEEKNGQVVTGLQYAHARDAYAFGRLAEALLEYLVDLGDLTKTFELRIQDEFLHQDPRQRPHVSSLLQDRLFRNEFLEIKMFLKNITLKSDEEKKEFFCTVVEKLLSLPADLVASRLAEPLLSRFVLLDTNAVDHVIPHVLTPGEEDTDINNKVQSKETHKEDRPVPILPRRLYQKHVIPILYRIFHVKDAHIRLVILTHFRHFAHLFDKESLQDVILPQLLLGLRDTNDQIVCKSLEALAVLVPVLGGDAVIGRSRSKIFIEGKPRALKIEETSSGDHIPVPNTVSKVLDLTKSTTGEVCNGDLKRHPSDESEDRKLQLLKEREKRKQEAKRKAEERRRKRENKKIQAEKVSERTIKMDQDLTTEQQTSTADINILEDINRDSEKEEGDKPLTGSISAAKAQKEKEIHSNIERNESEEDAAPLSENEENWTDWDEEQAMDAAIEKEIEEEMENLERKDAELRLSPVEPIHIDWSGVEEKVEVRSIIPKEAKKGKLKLKSPSMKEEAESGKSFKSPRSKSLDSGSKEEADDFSWNTSDWAETPANQPSSLASPRQQQGPSNSSRKNSTTEKAKGRESGSTGGHMINTEQLGAEFDVLAIEIKATPKVQEFDFFADMAPDISPSASLHLGSKTTSEADTLDDKKKQEITPKQTPISFAAMDITTDVTEPGGWEDEDLEWGEDDKW